MNTSQNFRDMSLKELKDICRGDTQKYRGFSSLKKADLINFMYQKNSTHLRPISRPYYYLADCSHIFETPEEHEERIQSYYEPKPEDSIIQDLISGLRCKYPRSNVIFDKHSDENNDLIYRANKGKYVSQYGSLGENGEMILYHGTDEKNLISILNDDFRLTNNPVHGHMFGKGIYFTNDIEKAIYYSERGKSTKYIIVCNVHVGDICKGYSTMNIHPKIPDRDKLYDTSVDDVYSPKQFIKKKNGTYNILGIITIENYIEKSNHINSQFTGSFQLINTLDYHISLYWVPDHIVNNLPNVAIRSCRKMSEISRSYNSNHGITKQLCQIGHTFICVAHFPTGFDPLSSDAIIRIFKSKKKGEVITI
tara:strand:- start:1332 stop:2426 length:1095 start_codon:yes stop_codon:yes gene_type:complete